MSARRLPYLDLVEAKLRVPRGEGGLWTVMRRLDESGPWSARDVWLETNENRGSVHQYLRRLKLAGIVADAGTRMMGGKNPQRAPLYRLVRRPIETPRIDRHGRELPEPLIEILWRTVKMAKTFTAAELAQLAGREGKPVNVNSARSYCDRLHHAGLLSRSVGADRLTRYGLIRNIGAKAPKILASRIVFDPNANAVIGEGVAREVAP